MKMNGPLNTRTVVSNSETIRAFADAIYLKMTGKSLTVIEAEQRIAAAKISKQGELELPYFMQMEQKTMQRKYANLGTVLTKAAPHITTPENKVADDNDFFWNLLEHSKDISNEQMQELLAKIVAGEYNAPETHSVATLQVLKSLDKKSITQFKNMGCLLLNRYQVPLCFFSESDNRKKRFTQFQASYADMLSLQSLGLFSANDAQTKEQYTINQYPAMHYFNKTLLFESEKTDQLQNDVTFPTYYGLSQVGGEIIHYLQPEFNSDYFDWLKENLKIDNFKLKQTS